MECVSQRRRYHKNCIFGKIILEFFFSTKLKILENGGLYIIHYKLECVKLSPYLYFMSVQFSSVAQSCLTLCDPMNYSTPGFLVHHQLPETTQTHVHRVGDIQLSHPLSSPSPPAFNLSQHQSLFQ